MKQQTQKHETLSESLSFTAIQLNYLYTIQGT